MCIKEYTHMQITDLLKPQSTCWMQILSLARLTPFTTLGELRTKAATWWQGRIFKSSVRREESGSTGLGDGIATPHAKLCEGTAAAMVVPQWSRLEALGWLSLPAYSFHDCGSRGRRCIFSHVEVLSKPATMVIDPDFKEALIQVGVVKLIDSRAITAKEEGNFGPICCRRIYQTRSRDQKANQHWCVIEAKGYRSNWKG